MTKLSVFALANTFAILDLILHPVFHLWGWFLPKSYESAMSEFVIDLQLQVREQFTPIFFVFWFLEVLLFWVLGASTALLYNNLVKEK